MSNIPNRPTGPCKWERIYIKVGDTLYREIKVISLKWVGVSWQRREVVRKVGQ